MDPKPAVEHRCEGCYRATTPVLYDRPLERWLCHWCWFATPPPGPPRSITK